MPVFWLASEDHDFDEINHINLFGKTIQWDSSQGGAVGRIIYLTSQRSRRFKLLMGKVKMLSD